MALAMAIALAPSRPAGAQTWNAKGSGVWSTASNWTPTGAPNGPGASATLGNATTGTSTITLDSAVTLSSLTYSGANQYRLTGTNLNFAPGASITATTSVQEVIGNNVLLNGALTVTLPTSPMGSLLQTGNVFGASGSLTLAGGIMTLAGAATYGGGTTVQPGATLVVGAGTNGSLSGNVTNNGTVTFARSDNSTFSGNITGNGLINKGIQASTLILTGTIDGNASVAVSGGSIQVGNGGTSGSLGAGSVILYPSNSTLTFNRSDTVVQAGNVAGNGKLVQAGPGTTVLTGTNNTLAGTTISAGTLQVGDGTPGGGGSITGNVANSGTLAFNRAGDLAYGGVVSGTCAFRKDGAGVLTVTGASTYGGATTIANGTLKVGAADALSDASAFTVASGATLDLNGNSAGVGSLAGAGQVKLGGGTLTAGGNNASTTFSGAVSGPTGGLVKVGSGTLTLDGANTIAGGVSVSAGTLRIGSGGTSGSLVGDVTVDSGTTLSFNRSDTATYAGKVSGAGALRQAGSGTTMLTGDVAPGGGTSIIAGTLQVGDGSAATGSLAGPVSIVAGAALAFNRPGASTFGGATSGAGGMTLRGGTLTLTGVNTHTGTTAVNGGSLVAGAFNTLSRNSALVIGAAGTVDVAGFGQTVASLSGAGTVTGNRTLTVGIDNTSTTFAGSFVSGATLAKNGTGTLTLTGASTNASGVQVQGGTLQIGNGGTTGSVSGPISLNATVVFNRSDDVTYGGVVSSGANPGTMVKQGNNVLTLTGTSTASGTLNIAAGTVQIGDGGTSGSIGFGSTINNGTLAWNRADNGVLAGNISGGGTLVKTGAGTLTLTGDNGFTGGTTVLAGTLAGTTASLRGSIANNAAVVFDQSTGGTYAGAMSGEGTLTKLGAGTVTLTGANSHAGATVVSGGTLRAGVAYTLSPRSDVVVGAGGTLDLAGFDQAVRSLSGTGTVVLNGAALVANGGGASSTFTGTMTGSGRLVKNGGGTLTLAGANTYSGGTSVEAGTLVVNGSLSSSTVVKPGAMLGGSGMIAGTLVVDGTIAPGNSIGTFNVTGAYVQNAGSTYRVEINPAGQSDRIAVTGTATLNGGTVQVVAAPGPYARGTTTYTILTATGGVSGTFAAVTSDYAFRSLRLGYDATSAWLSVTTNAFIDGAATGNQKAVAQALDAAADGAGGDFATVLTALANLGLAQGPAALDALSGQPWADMPSTNLAGVQLFMDAVGRQVAAARRASSPGERVALAQGCSAACGDDAAGSGWNAWGTALGGTGTIAGDGNASALSWTLGGFAAGLDRRVAPGVRTGAALGATSGSQSVAGASFIGPSSLTAVQATLYASLSAGGSYVDALAGYGASDNQLARTILVPGLATRIARGRAAAHQLFAQVEAGHRFEIDRGTSAGLTPYLRFQAASVALNGFSEWGAESLDLSAAPWTTTSVRAGVGLQADAALPVGLESPLGVQLRLGWAHECADTARPFAAALAGAPANGFTVYGATPPRDQVTLGLAVETSVASNVSAFLRYDGALAAGADAHAVGLGLRLRF